MGFDFFLLLKPELSITVLIFLLLINKITDTIKCETALLNTVNIVLFLSLLGNFLEVRDGTLFNGMFVTHHFILLQKTALTLGTLIISLLAYPWLKSHTHRTEFYILLLSSLLGMHFMLSAKNFLMLYVGFELASIPLAVLAGFNLSNSKSSESAVKLILSSAFASCFMLFGLSLLYGTNGSLLFTSISESLTSSPLEMLAFCMIVAGFLFKMSIVPLHFWTADVYEGAPTMVTAYLSVISKGSIAFIFLMVLSEVFSLYASQWTTILAITAVLTMTIGNLFAMQQSNIKRLLAFSSIAQAGYILFAIAGNSVQSSSSVFYFILVYIFSNIAAFGVVSEISEKSGKENISDYKGLYAKNKMSGLVLLLALFSLAGIPPTAGFFGKFFLLSSAAVQQNYSLLIIAALNMVLSLYYYLRIVKVIMVDEADDTEFTQPIFPVKIAYVLCGLGILLAGLGGSLFDYIHLISLK